MLLFDQFHALVLPGGSKLGRVQATALETVLCAHGATLVPSAECIVAVGRSLSRKRRKTLVVLSGRSTPAEVEHDLLAAVIQIWQQQPPGRAVEQRASEALREIQCLVRDGVVAYVRHQWVSDSVVSAMRHSPEGRSGGAAALGHESSSAVPLPLQLYVIQAATYDEDRSEQEPKTWAVSEKIGGGGDDVKTFSNALSETMTDSKKKAATENGSGFIPVFFASHLNDKRQCSSPSTAGGGHTADVVLHQQMEQIRERRKRLRDDRADGIVVARGGQTLLGSSDDDDDDYPLQRTKPFHGEEAARKHEECPDLLQWKDATVASREAPVEMISVDAHNRRMQRSVAFIDRVKPFVCQQVPTRGGGEDEKKFAFDGGKLVIEDDEDEAAAEGFTLLRESQRGHGVGSGGGGGGGGGSTTADSPNPTTPLNQPLLTQLAALKEVYQATGDQWRMYAYNKAIGIIKRLPFQVERVEQLASYRGIGDRIMNKVKEILATGSTTKLNVLKSAPHIQAVEAFTKIWGVGPSTAKKLATHPSGKLVDIDSLRAFPQLSSLLSPVQLAGLSHYEDLQVRIPRDEVTIIVSTVKEAVRNVVGETRAARVDVVACGSYRRGRATSGDVDILLCDRNSKSEDGLLTAIIAQLDQRSGTRQTLKKKEASFDCGGASGSLCKEEGGGRIAHGYSFIIQDLTISNRSTAETHSDSWFGIVQLPDCSPTHRGSCPCTHRHSQSASQGTAVRLLSNADGVSSSSVCVPGQQFCSGVHLSRRLDIKVYPPDQFPFALLYFTGSDYFNRSMRLYCQKKGWSLSDKELKPVVRVRGEKVHETSHGVVCRTERDVFDAVGLPYKEPVERDV